jgi:acetyltransferase
MAFSVLRPPRGPRTAVLTNSGGPGVLAADALAEQGLDLVEFRPESVSRVAPLFPAEASVRNPLDMIASAHAPGYRAALDAILADPGVDAAVAIFTPPLGVRTTDVAEAIGEAARACPEKPLLAVLMGREGLPQGKRELQEAGVPAYIFPESAARALGALVRHGVRAGRPPRDVPDAAALGVDMTRVRSIVDEARRRGETKLSELDALALVEAYGVPTVGARLARTADEAAALARDLGDGPVALKVVSRRIVHKTDAGGVRLGVVGPRAAHDAYESIVASVSRAVPDAEVEGVLVQRQIEHGRELIVGITRQAGFGPLVMVGLGGVLVEVLRDASFRLAPIDAREAADMLRGLRGAKLLDALRGMPAVDRGAVADVLVRIARLGADFPEIEELDVNPLVLSAAGGVAVDARVLLGSPDVG